MQLGSPRPPSAVQASQGAHTSVDKAEFPLPPSAEYDEISRKISESRQCIMRIGETFVPKSTEVGAEVAELSKNVAEHDSHNKPTYTQAQIIRNQREEIENLQQELARYRCNSNIVTGTIVPSARALEQELQDKEIEAEKMELKLDQYALQLKLREQQIKMQKTQISGLQTPASMKSQRTVTAINAVMLESAIAPLCKTHIQSSEIKTAKQQVVAAVNGLLRKETEFLHTEIKALKEELEKSPVDAQTAKYSASQFEYETERAVDAITEKYVQEINRLKSEIFELNELIRTKDRQLDTVKEELRRTKGLISADHEIKEIQKSRITQESAELEDYRRMLRGRNIQSRRVLEDYENEINAKLLEMKKENMQIRMDHDELMKEVKCKTADRKQVKGKMDAILDQLQELKGFIGVSGVGDE